MESDKIREVKARRRRNAMIREVTGMSPRRRRQTEHEIQVSCFRWLEYAMPTLYRVTFAVPNGGLRDEITAVALNAEGLKKGVSDVIVLKSNRYYGSLCIEMKTKSGTQRPEQKQWEKDCKLIGGAQYKICRSLRDFKEAVIEYCLNMETYEKTVFDMMIVQKAKEEKAKLEEEKRNEGQDKKV